MIMKHRLLLFAFCVAVLFACKKDENKIYFEGGTAPVLSASTTAPQVLTDANKNNTAIRFSWTNPNYQFTTGISSQNVTYILQVDTTVNFTNPDRQEVSISNDLNVTLTVKELNTILSKMNLMENMPHNVAFRIKSVLGSNAVPMYSNVIQMTLTPYLDVAVPVPPTGELYLTGDATASGWTNNPPVSQKFTKESSVVYSITTNLQPGFFYKFLSTPNQWQPQYGGSSATGGDLGFNMGTSSDPAAIPTPSQAGSYKITVNFKTGKYTVVRQ